MTPQLLIFLGALIYLGWVFVRYIKRHNRKNTPFIEVLEDQPASKVERKSKKRPGRKDSDDDSEWRKRVQAEIEDMTK